MTLKDGMQLPMLSDRWPQKLTFPPDQSQIA